MAVGDAYAFPGFLTPVLTQISFQSQRLLFSHASAGVRGENTPERNFASTGSQTHNHQVMSPTRSPLGNPGGDAPLCARASYQVQIQESVVLLHLLTLSQTSPGFYVFAIQVF